MTTPIRLTGLDGKNPGAFMAALGVLEVVTHFGYEGRLRWVRAAGWEAELLAPGIDTVDELVELLVADAHDIRGDEVFHFAYEKDGKKDGARVQDLKAEPAYLRATLLVPASKRARPDDRSDADLVVALVAENAVDGGGKAKPTALHFMAGQQQFLGMIRDVRAGVTAEHLREAIVGPWVTDEPLPVLGWDVGNSRIYALRASNPSKDKKTGYPGLDWLGVRSLPFFPTYAVKRNTRTTGVYGGWKKGAMVWPIWEAALAKDAVGALLRMPLMKLNPAARGVYGIGEIFEAAIHRSDQGGYGNFAPPKVVL